MRRFIIVSLLASGCYRNLDFAPCQEDPTQSICFDTGSTDTAVPETSDDGGSDAACSGPKTQACGKCGTQSRTCVGGVWTEWDTCTGEKECTPGETAAGAACTGVLEKSTKKCNDTCTFDPQVCALPSGWTKIADAPSSFPGRTSPASVWTGGELIVYGGGDGEVGPGKKDGALYRAYKNDWLTLPAQTIVAYGRKEAAAVWTGFSMLVWGGRDGSTFLSDGLEFQGDTKTWSALKTSPLSARSPGNVVWIPTLKKMFVFGGYNSSGCLSDSAVYDWTAEVWTTTAAFPLSCRSAAAAIWTGSEVLVWGGRADAGTSLNDGALYNPTTNAWRSLPASTLPARAIPFPALIAAGNVLIFGGADFSSGSPTLFSDYATVSTGVPATWSTKAMAPTSVKASFAGSLWSTPTAMFTWSGLDAATSDFMAGGSAYIFTSGTWLPMATTGAPISRSSAITVAAGECGLVWGGYGKPGGGVTELLTDGAFYCP